MLMRHAHNAPVAKMTNIRIILAFAACDDLEVMASDVKTVFLHCQLRNELYCKQIPGHPQWQGEHNPDSVERYREYKTGR